MTITRSGGIESAAAFQDGFGTRIGSGWRIGSSAWRLLSLSRTIKAIPYGGDRFFTCAGAERNACQRLFFSISASDKPFFDDQELTALKKSDFEKAARPAVGLDGQRADGAEAFF